MVQMAEVIVTYKIMPKGLEVDLDKLESTIKDSVKPDQIKREPMAFGLYSLSVVKIIPDESGESDKIEDKLRKIDGVSEVQVVDLTRTL